MPCGDDLGSIVASLGNIALEADWTLRVRHGVPGPIYSVDAHGSGPATANAAHAGGGAFVWRQPRTPGELGATLTYLVGGWMMHGEVGDDGDDHWTLDGIRVWWAQRAAHAAIYREAGVPDVARYFESELPAYLRAYAFLLEHGRRAHRGDELPDIDAPPEIVIAPATTDFTSALELLVGVERLVTARGLVHGTLPLWGARPSLDVPGVWWGGGRAPVPGVCPAERPFVYHQPASGRELEQCIAAAIAEPDAFGVTTTLASSDDIRRWWKIQRERFRKALHAAGIANADAYVDDELATYLRGYLYVIEQGRVPPAGAELPALDAFYGKALVLRRRHQLPFTGMHQLPLTRGEIIDEPEFGGRFEERNPLNVPGMFYGAMTDTCGTGPGEAPNNVACDVEGQELVFRQPRNESELLELFSAAEAECFDGYGTDGNEHWTVELVRAWWADRASHREAWRALGIEGVDAMFEDELPRYLRGYLFLLEHGRPPNAADTLPAL